MASTGPLKIGNDFTYEPLNDSDIRLLKIQEQRTQDGLVQCTLQHFKLEKTLKFHALSYVWGDQSKTKPITLNGKRFNVTENLHDALIQLPSIDETDSSVLWWIDATCIDQKNLAEKSKQIPKMTEIYASAEAVLAWLGTEPPVHESLIAKATFAMEVYGEAFDEALFSTLQNEAAEVFSGITMAALDIIHATWFSRLWVIQEFALNKTVKCRIGSYSVDVDTLLRLFACIQPMARGSDHALLEATNIPLLRFFQMSTLRLRFKTSDWHARSFVDQLLYLVSQTTGKVTTEPHDRIYGLLGMTNTKNIPSKLLPNYKLPFAQVYQEYARYAIENSGDLSILDCTSNELKNVPSWVPDLRFSVVRRLKSSTTAVPAFSPDGRIMTVEGVRLGRVLMSISRSSQTPAEYLSCVLETILAASAWTRAMPLQDVGQEWIHSYWELFSMPHDEPTFQSIQDIIQSNLEGVEEDPSRDGYDIVLEQAVESLAGIGYLVLESGDIGSYSFDRKPDSDYLVYALKGSSRLSLLGPCENGYKRGCPCTLWTRKVELDEQLFSEQTVERIDLV